MKPLVSIIAAHDDNFGIGLDNDLPWHISKDLQHFKNITTGKPVIMGRNTYESIVKRLGKPLPDRSNIVISSHALTHTFDNVLRAESLTEALELAEKEHVEEIFIIGGAQLYKSSIAQVDKLYITKVHGEFGCDTFFPHYENDFEQISTIDDVENEPKFSWIELLRK